MTLRGFIFILESDLSRALSYNIWHLKCHRPAAAKTQYRHYGGISAGRAADTILTTRIPSKIKNTHIICLENTTSILYSLPAEKYWLNEIRFCFILSVQHKVQQLSNRILTLPYIGCAKCTYFINIGLLLSISFSVENANLYACPLFLCREIIVPP